MLLSSRLHYNTTALVLLDDGLTNYLEQSYTTTNTKPIFSFQTIILYHRAPCKNMSLGLVYRVFVITDYIVNSRFMLIANFVEFYNQEGTGLDLRICKDFNLQVPKLSLNCIKFGPLNRYYWYISALLNAFQTNVLLQSKHQVVAV